MPSDIISGQSLIIHKITCSDSELGKLIQPDHLPSSYSASTRLPSYPAWPSTLLAGKSKSEIHRQLLQSGGPRRGVQLVLLKDAQRIRWRICWSRHRWCQGRCSNYGLVSAKMQPRPIKNHCLAALWWKKLWTVYRISEPSTVIKNSRNSPLLDLTNWFTTLGKWSMKFNEPLQAVRLILDGLLTRGSFNLGRAGFVLLCGWLIMYAIYSLSGRLPDGCQMFCAIFGGMIIVFGCGAIACNYPCWASHEQTVHPQRFTLLEWPNYLVVGRLVMTCSDPACHVLKSL